MGKHRVYGIWIFLCVLLCFAMAVKAEYISKPYEIENVLLTIYFFDTEEEMQAYYRDNFAELEGELKIIDERLRGFGYTEVNEEHNICHLDMYVVRPQEVDDEHVTTIGHEVLHCVYGPGYHVRWFSAEVDLEVTRNK